MASCTLFFFTCLYLKAKGHFQVAPFVWTTSFHFWFDDSTWCLSFIFEGKRSLLFFLFSFHTAELWRFQSNSASFSFSKSLGFPKIRTPGFLLCQVCFHLYFFEVLLLQVCRRDGRSSSWVFTTFVVAIPILFASYGTEVVRRPYLIHSDSSDSKSSWKIRGLNEVVLVSENTCIRK